MINHPFDRCHSVTTNGSPVGPRSVAKSGWKGNQKCSVLTGRSSVYIYIQITWCSSWQCYITQEQSKVKGVQPQVEVSPTKPGGKMAIYPSKLFVCCFLFFVCCRYRKVASFVGSWVLSLHWPSVRHIQMGSTKEKTLWLCSPDHVTRNYSAPTSREEINKGTRSEVKSQCTIGGLLWFDDPRSVSGFLAFHSQNRDRETWWAIFCV